MKKKAIVLILVLASVSLLGIVLTQLYWVTKSLALKEDQFDSGVRIALKSVENQLIDNKKDSVFQRHLYELSCRQPKLVITDLIPPALVDSLLSREFKFMSINEKYFYGIYNKSTKKFVMGNFHDKEEPILESPFQFSVNKLYRPGDYEFSVYFPTKRSIILRQMEIWLLLSVFFLIVLIFSFVYVIFSIFQQKKLSEMKNDFINNMTHEFKTPLATSSLAAEMILRTEMIKNPGRIKKYAKVIIDENMRLQGQVEQVLQMATLENSEHRFKFKKTNIHSLIESVIESFDLRILENKIKINKKLHAKIPTIIADRVHILNVFYNLIDNAIKYTPEKPVIEIETWNTNRGIHIKISDNGIGIDLPNQKDVFKNLYRVPTGNIHEVRGFGLGLYYAKTVVDYHHGNIQLESELKKGTAFDVFLPFNEKESM